MYLILYDISNPKRLKRVAKILNRYGRRIQKSAYECEIGKYQFEELGKILQQIRNNNDAIAAYYFPGNSGGDRLLQSTPENTPAFPFDHPKNQYKKRKNYKKQQKQFEKNIIRIKLNNIKRRRENDRRSFL